MKKLICAVLVCALALSLALTGCGGNGSTGLAGTAWTLSSMEANGIKVDGDALSQLGLDSTSIKFEDSNFTMSHGDESKTGTYTVKDKTVTMTVDGDDATATLQDDGTLKLEVDSTTSMTFTKK